jgi:hypothetical protein
LGLFLGSIGFSREGGAYVMDAYFLRRSVDASGKANENTPDSANWLKFRKDSVSRLSP